MFLTYGGMIVVVDFVNCAQTQMEIQKALQEAVEIFFAGFVTLAQTP